MLLALFFTVLVGSSLTFQSVTTLTDSVYDDFKNDEGFKVVFFHSNDCPYCSYVKDIFEKMSLKLQEKGKRVKIGMINAETQTKAQKDEEIQEYPVIKFFSGSKLYTYLTSKIATESLLDAMEPILSNEKVPEYVVSDRDYVRFNNEDYAIVLSFPEITQVEKDYVRNLQMLYPAIPVFYTKTGLKFDSKLFPNEKEEKPYRLLFKRIFDEGDHTFALKDMFENNDIIHSIWKLKDPRVMRVNSENMDNLFSGKYPAIIIFDKDLNSQAVQSMSIALKNKKFSGMRLKSDGTEPESEALKLNIGVEDHEYPCVRIMSHNEGETLRYRYDGKLTLEGLEEFIEAFEKEEIPTYLKESKPVSNRGQIVLQLNRGQLMKMVQEEEVVTVVGLISNHCLSCSGMKEMMIQARSQLHDKKSFVFATVDIGTNDVDGVILSDSGSILIYSSGKSESYSGSKEASELASFLNNRANGEL